MASAARLFAIAALALPVESDREGEWEHVLEFGDIALALDAESLLDGLDAVGDFASGGNSSSSDGDGGGGD